MLLQACESAYYVGHLPVLLVKNDFLYWEPRRAHRSHHARHARRAEPRSRRASRGLGSYTRGLTLTVALNSAVILLLRLLVLKTPQLAIHSQAFHAQHFLAAQTAEAHAAPRAVNGGGSDRCAHVLGGEREEKSEQAAPRRQFVLPSRPLSDAAARTGLVGLRAAAPLPPPPPSPCLRCPPSGRTRRAPRIRCPPFCPRPPYRHTPVCHTHAPLLTPFPPPPVAAPPAAEAAPGPARAARPSPPRPDQRAPPAPPLPPARLAPRAPPRPARRRSPARLLAPRSEVSSGPCRAQVQAGTVCVLLLCFLHTYAWQAAAVSLWCNYAILYTLLRVRNSCS